jgi:hypothetical protein
METTLTLEPVYDGRKSFYGKAQIIDRLWDTGQLYKRQLRSYNTIVAEIEYTDGERTAEVFGTYSPTTLRHIKDFLYQNGFEVGSKKEIEEMYIKG